MTGYHRVVAPEKLCHLIQCQPDRLVLEMHIKGADAVLGLIEDDFAKIGVHVFLIHLLLNTFFVCCHPLDATG